MKTLIILALTLSSFSYEKPVAKETSVYKMITNAEGEELDKIMTIWFDEFHKLQTEGKSMTHADNAALMAVKKSFK